MKPDARYIRVQAGKPDARYKGLRLIVDAVEDDEKTGGIILHFHYSMLHCSGAGTLMAHDDYTVNLFKEYIMEDRR